MLVSFTNSKVILNNKLCTVPIFEIAVFRLGCCNMLEHLPTELQETIFGMLDGTSLLRASCVSTQWNRIISGLQVVWRELCLRNAFGNVAVDWKKQYLTCHHLLQDMKEGKAFHHKNFAPKCFHSSNVRDVTYSNGYLLAAIQNIVRIWQSSDLKPIAAIEMPYDVFRLNLSEDGCILVVGHYEGFITSWLLERFEGGVKTNLLQEYIKHDDNVVCLSIHTESDLLCSGSRDRTVRLWRLTSGELLQRIPTDGWVAQVIIFHMREPSLIITDQSSVRLCSWQTLNRELKIHQLDIPVDKKVSMRKLVMHGKCLMFVRNCSIVILNLETLQELRSFPLECKDLVLLASGKRFMLVTLWESCQKNSRLAVVDIFTGEIVGTYPIPFCREFVMVGDTKWLDALPHHEKEQLVAIGWLMGIVHVDELTDMLYLIKWA